MPVTTVGSSTYNSAGSSVASVPLGAPPGIAANDLLVAHVAVDDNGSPPTVTAPAGWSLIQTTARSTVTRLLTYAKTATGSEPGSYSWTLSGGREAVGILSVFRGADLTVVPDAAGGAAVSASGGAVTAPSVTATAPNVFLLGVFAVRTDSTFTAPAGMSVTTAVASGVSNSPSLGLATQQLTAAGATGDRIAATSFASTTDRHGQLIALRTANNAPNAPTLVSPVGGAAIDRAVTQRLSWTFSDPDSGDSQSKYNLRYRLVGAGSWNIVTGTTPNTFHDFAGGTLAAGDYEWQVRTYDSLGLVGAYSGSEFFTAATTPTAPTITDPLSGGTVSSDPRTVTWSTPTQDAYQVRTVADLAGSPDTGTVYTDTGTVVSTTARSRTVAFPTNGRYEHIQVRVRSAGLWSTWTSIRVLVSYTPPAAATLGVLADDATASITVAITNPAPAGGEPTVISNDLYRREGGSGDGIRIATDLPSSGTFVDYTPASGVDYAYRAVSTADNDTSSTSAWTA